MAADTGVSVDNCMVAVAREHKIVSQCLATWLNLGEKETHLHDSSKGR